jgi:predicted NAD/FAD-binding protein
MSKPKIAVIGAGVAGLSTAWKLQNAAEITIFEKNDYIGGHTRTLTVPEGPDKGTRIDTGFIVMNHRNYPHFTALLKEWEVALEDSDMSFSYHESQSDYAYAGTTFKGIFPSAKRLLDPTHWKLLFELKRFGKVGSEALRDHSASQQSLGDFLEKHHFFQNNGLLTLKDRPQWRIVSGGSQSYVQKALSMLKADVRTRESPDQIFRSSEGVTLGFSDGRKERFDHVVIGAHADEALKLLGDPDEDEKRLLGAWTYQANQVVLHSWEEVMPAPKACWASWNFAREQGFNAADPVSVSYWMNRLQNLRTQKNYFVTLNRRGEIPEAYILNSTTLHHPQYDQKAIETQAPLQKRNGTRNTWLVGSYFGYGFHEDAVKSAVETAARIEAVLG